MADFGTPGYQPPGAQPPPAAAPVGSPAYQSAAAQAVGQVQADPGTDAGEAVSAMQEQAVRAAMSDYEAKLKAMMEAADKQAASFASQFDQMQRQLATVQQQAGPPTAVNLAKSLSTRVQSIAAANPDLGTSHFAGILSQAAGLADAVSDVASGQGDAASAEKTANGVISWFERSHPRLSGKFLEGAHAAVDEAERIIEELPKLAPAAMAIAAAV